MVRTYVPKMSQLPVKYEPGFLLRMDGRTELARSLMLTYNSVIDDLGGTVDLPYVKLALVERYVFLEEFLRQLEQKIAKSGAVNDPKLLGVWTQGVNSLTGLSRLLGLGEKRRNSGKAGGWNQYYDQQPKGSDPATDETKGEE